MIGNFLLLTQLAAAVVQSDESLKYFYYVSIPVMVVGLAALIVVIMKLVKMFGDSFVCRVPLQAANEVEITRGGNLNLCLQISKIAFFRVQGLSYRLISRTDGREIDLHTASLFSMSQRKAFMTITFPVRTFAAAAGKYTLQVSGFDPQTDYAGYSLVIEKPTGLKTTFYIFGIIFTGGMFIAGFVFTLISLNLNK